CYLMLWFDGIFSLNLLNDRSDIAYYNNISYFILYFVWRQDIKEFFSRMNKKNKLTNTSTGAIGTLYIIYIILFMYMYTVEPISLFTRLKYPNQTTLINPNSGSDDNNIVGDYFKLSFAMTYVDIYIKNK
ncbi:hypothetical protein ACJX0J_005681, partial [Zea mays]